MNAEARRKLLRRLILSIGKDIAKEAALCDMSSREAQLYVESRLLELCICYGFILNSEVGNGDSDDS